MSELWGPGKTLPPAITDPVVIDGTKFRIRSIEAGPQGDLAVCRTSFRPSPGVDFRRATIALESLVWDRIAGGWRSRTEGAD